MDNSYKRFETMTGDAWSTPWWLTLLAAVLAIVILVVDLLLPLGVAGGVPYVAVVLLGWWFPKRNQTIILAAICTVLTLVGYYYSPEGGTPSVVTTNRFLAFLAIWISAILLLMARAVSYTHLTRPTIYSV